MSTKLDEIDEADWDSALDEWEKTAFADSLPPKAPVADLAQTEESPALELDSTQPSLASKPRPFADAPAQPGVPRVRSSEPPEAAEITATREAPTVHSHKTAPPPRIIPRVDEDDEDESTNQYEREAFGGKTRAVGRNPLTSSVKDELLETRESESVARPPRAAEPALHVPPPRTAQLPRPGQSAPLPKLAAPAMPNIGGSRIPRPNPITSHPSAPVTRRTSLENAMQDQGGLENPFDMDEVPTRHRFDALAKGEMRAEMPTMPEELEQLSTGEISTALDHHFNRVTKMPPSIEAPIEDTENAALEREGSSALGAETVESEAHSEEEATSTGGLFSEELEELGPVSEDLPPHLAELYESAQFLAQEGGEAAALGLVGIFSALGKEDDAIKFAEVATRSRGASAVSFVLLRSLAGSQNDIATLTKQALASESPFVEEESRLALGVALWKEGDLRGAAREWSEASSLDRGDLRSELLALALGSKDDPESEIGRTFHRVISSRDEGSKIDLRADTAALIDRLAIHLPDGAHIVRGAFDPASATDERTGPAAAMAAAREPNSVEEALADSPARSFLRATLLFASGATTPQVEVTIPEGATGEIFRDALLWLSPNDAALPDDDDLRVAKLLLGARLDAPTIASAHSLSRSAAFREALGLYAERQGIVSIPFEPGSLARAAASLAPEALSDATFALLLEAHGQSADSAYESLDGTFVDLAAWARGGESPNRTSENVDLASLADALFEGGAVPNGPLSELSTRWTQAEAPSWFGESGIGLSDTRLRGRYPNDVAAGLLDDIRDGSLAAPADWYSARAESATTGEGVAFFRELAATLLAREKNATRAITEATTIGGAVFNDYRRWLGPFSEEHGPELTEVLLEEMRDAEERRDRTEAALDLARLDELRSESGRGSVLWHRTVIEEIPEHIESLFAALHFQFARGTPAEIAETARLIASAVGPTQALGTAHFTLAQLFADDLFPSFEPKSDMPILLLRSLHAKAQFGASPRVEWKTLLALSATAKDVMDRGPIATRAAEAALRENEIEAARMLLEKVTYDSEEEIVAAFRLVELLTAVNGDGLGEACERLANLSSVDQHRTAALRRALASYRAIESADDELRVLEQLRELDPKSENIATELEELYTRLGDAKKLAEMIELRAESRADPTERLALLVLRAGALERGGLDADAQRAYERVLGESPDHFEALLRIGEISERLADYARAEEAWVRALRLEKGSTEQRDLYLRLANLYEKGLANPVRAEAAYAEVLKRDPEVDVARTALAQIYAERGDVVRAASVLEGRLAYLRDPEERRAAMLEIIKATQEKDPRRAERSFEALRKEFPLDTDALRLQVEFFRFHKQAPAAQITLDRTLTEIRRAIASGRLSPPLFALAAEAHRLREKRAAASLAEAAGQALGGAARFIPAFPKALSAQVIEAVRPETISPQLAALFATASGPLEAFANPALRQGTTALKDPSLLSVIEALGREFGIGQCEVLVSKALHKTCVPLSASTPVLLIGEPFLKEVGTGPARFLLVRALQTMATKTTILLQLPTKSLVSILGAWGHVLAPTWTPHGVGQQELTELSKKVRSSWHMKGLARNDVSLLAMEALSTIADSAPHLGSAAAVWANRTALLATGDPAAALDGIAWNQRLERAPQGDERVSWAAHNYEAREVLAFAAVDAAAIFR